MNLARWIVIAAVSGCGGAAAPKPTTPARAPAPKPPVAPADKDPLVAARVDGVSILTWDVDRHFDADTKTKIKETADPIARDALRTKARRRVLGDMIDRQLFIAAAMAKGIRAEPEEIEAALAEIEKQNNMTQAQLTDVVIAAGFGSLDDYRKELGEQIQVLRYMSVVAPAPEPRDAATKRVSAELRAKATIAIALPEAPAAKTGLGLGTLLTNADLEAVLHHALPKFETGPLEVDDASADYESLHYKAVGMPETSDLAIRVWRAPPKDLEQRWTELHALPDVHDETGLADGTFRASGSDIFGRGFIDRKASIIMLITCGSTLCASPEQALAIAKLLHERQGRLKPR